MYTNDMVAIRRNWARAHEKVRPKTNVRVMSTSYPDIEDFNEAAIHRKAELDRLMLPQTTKQ